MNGRQKYYPDNSAIFALKAEGRLQRAAATFAEKLAALDNLRERVQPIIHARDDRNRAKLSRPKPVAR